MSDTWNRLHTSLQCRTVRNDTLSHRLACHLLNARSGFTQRPLQRHFEDASEQLHSSKFTEH
jgi:hypothetical protein